MHLKSGSLRRARFFYILLSIFSLSHTASAQNVLQKDAGVAGDGLRDPTAVQLLHKVVDQMGGNKAIGLIHDCTAAGQQRYEIEGSVASGPIRWQNAGREFRYEYPAGNGKNVLTSGHGRIALRTFDGKPKRILSHVVDADFPAHLVAQVLWQKLHDSRFSIQFQNDGKTDSQGIIKIILVLDRDHKEVMTRQTWEIDSATLLPVRVTSNVPDVSDASLIMEQMVDFSDYRPVNGVLVPFHLHFSLGGQIRWTVALESVAFNQDLPPGTFAAPNGDKL